MWFCFQLLKRKDKITIFSIKFAPVQNPFRCVVGRIRSGYDCTFHKTLQNAWKSRTPCRRNPHLWVKSSLSLRLGEIEDKITKTTAISLAAIFVRKATFSFVENLRALTVWMWARISIDWGLVFPKKTQAQRRVKKSLMLLPYWYDAILAISFTPVFPR